MRVWRRRRWCGVAIFFFSALAHASEVSVTLVDGAVEVTGVPVGGRNAEDVVRVSISAEAPPIVGEYHVDGTTVRFQPMFPFDPGREYVVRVDAGDEPVFATVGLPARDIAPSTVVTEIYPTSDTLPENQLKLYIHFSAPMAGGDGLPFVKLVDANGDDVADPFLPLGDAFWDHELRRYTVFFDPGRVKRGILPNEEMGRPILDGHRYTLVIDPAWRDADGLPLEKGYEKAIAATAADETPIDPDTWRVHAPRAGTRASVIIDFSEPLDHAVALRSITIEGVGGRAELTDQETRWAFTPEKVWSPGHYTVVAEATLEDLAGNQIGTPFEVDVFDRIDSPDDVAETYRIAFVVRE